MLSPQHQEVLTVTQLNRSAKRLLEQHFNHVVVEGEISNFTQPSSGHWYFTLKDNTGQVRCAMFRGQNMYVRPRPKNGDKVKATAKVSLYEGRGDFQLIVDKIEAAGAGNLQQQFEQLKQALFQQGLFDEGLKQALPKQPEHIAVVTSPTGAAIRDVVSVLKRRMPSIPVTIIPCAVQGEDAPGQIQRALEIAENDARFDVILLCRGGGSIEDLWAFNNEALARRIVACKKPVVSAVGHEIDFTIADFVADVRAPTPSAAAELLSPDANELLRRVHTLSRTLQQSMQRTLQHATNQVAVLRQQLKHPKDKLQNWSQNLDQLEVRLLRAQQQAQARATQRLSEQERRLMRETPTLLIQQHHSQVQQFQQRLQRAVHTQLSQHNKQLAFLMQSLDHVSPLNIMQRGYTITTDAKGRVLQSAKEVSPAQALTIQFADGKVSATATSDKS